MTWIAVVFALLIAAIGIAGLVDPARILDLASIARTSAGLYFVAAIRVAFGSVLIGVAAASRFPRTVRILGAFIVLSGIITPFIGVEGAGAIVQWWSARGLAFMRAWASLAVIVGLFIAYALTSGRGST